MVKKIKENNLNFKTGLNVKFTELKSPYRFLKEKQKQKIDKIFTVSFFGEVYFTK